MSPRAFSRQVSPRTALALVCTFGGGGGDKGGQGARACVRRVLHVDRNRRTENTQLISSMRVRGASRSLDGLTRSSLHTTTHTHTKPEAERHAQCTEMWIKRGASTHSITLSKRAEPKSITTYKYVGVRVCVCFEHLHLPNNVLKHFHCDNIIST